MSTRRKKSKHTAVTVSGDYKLTVEFPVDSVPHVENVAPAETAVGDTATAAKAPPGKTRGDETISSVNLL